jgi:hypothetical protein
MSIYKCMVAAKYVSAPVHTHRFLKRHEKELLDAVRASVLIRLNGSRNAKEEKLHNDAYTLLVLSFGAPSMGGFVKRKCIVR